MSPDLIDLNCVLTAASTISVLLRIDLVPRVESKKIHCSMMENVVGGDGSKGSGSNAISIM